MSEFEKPGKDFDDGFFDDISRIVPHHHVYHTASREVSCADIEFGNDAATDSGKIDYSGAILGKTASENYSYSPENPLLTSVNIRARSSPYGYYGDFVDFAKRYIDCHGKVCEFVPFPAYVPEYRTMKKAQLDYYFYFRDSVKRNVAIKTSLSYILLMLFEIINLPELLSPSIGVNLICRIFKLYRGEFEKLDFYIADWLCDYCLIHRLPLPDEILPFAERFAELSGFGEFYLDPRKCSPELILKYISGYFTDRDNKYPETHELLGKHLAPAIMSALPRFMTDGTGAESDIKSKLAAMLPSILPLKSGARSSYRSALRAGDSNALITYTYRSFCGSRQLSAKLAGMIKYCENRVRAALSIRARLKCPTLGPVERELLDLYFDRVLPAPGAIRRAHPKSDEVIVNDALYAPESSTFSIDAARDIEHDSWIAAKILADFSDESNQEFSKSEENNLQCKSENDESRESIPSKYELEFLSFILEGDVNAAKAFAKSHGLLADALAESLNRYAFDRIGDSILEATSDGYEIIPDYIQEAEEWLKQ